MTADIVAEPLWQPSAGPGQRAGRRGVALAAVVITLSVLTLLVSAVAWQMLANRRMLEHRQLELQAQWLAHAAVERAAARLLDDPAAYTGEQVELVPLSLVRIDVSAVPQAPDVFEVRCEARYPVDPEDSENVVVRSATRRFRRMADEQRVRLEAVTDRGREE